MGRRKKISNIELEEMVRQGLGVSKIARELGVTKGAISKRLKALSVAINQRVVLHDAGEIIEKKLDAIAQLQKINDYANELLDLLMRWNRGDEEALQILEGQVRKVKVKGSEEEVTEYKFKDPRELALKAMQEIRGQLALQLEIFRALYDMTAVVEFQKEVLESIKEVAPDVRDKIIFNLQKRRAIRSTLDLH